MIEINTGNLPCCAFVSDVIDHVMVKEKMLKYLSIKPVYGFTGIKVKLFNTDYFVKNFVGIDNKYYDFINPVVERHNKSLSRYLQYGEDIVSSLMWYQQYQKGDHHTWHRHQDSIFTNIYYIELPDGTSHTTLRFLGKEFQIEVKEGQILTFPSFFEHCSKPNLSEHVKTVIGFNSS
jgi:hypothetical protein